MKIAYEVGPEKIEVGGIEFFLGIPKEVEDEMAEKILAKKVIPFKKVEGREDEGRETVDERTRDVKDDG